MVDGKCPLGEHSMVVSLLQQLCDRLKEEKKAEGDEQKEQWDAIGKQWEHIGKKVSNRTLMWGIGIFLTLAVCAVGFLWHNQSANRTEIMSEVKSISTAIVGENGVKEKISILGQKLDDHLKESHGDTKKEKR